MSCAVRSLASSICEIIVGYLLRLTLISNLVNCEILELTCEYDDMKDKMHALLNRARAAHNRGLSPDAKDQEFYYISKSMNEAKARREDLRIKLKTLYIDKYGADFPKFTRDDSDDEFEAAMQHRGSRMTARSEQDLDDD